MDYTRDWVSVARPFITNRSTPERVRCPLTKLRSAASTKGSIVRVAAKRFQCLFQAIVEAVEHFLILGFPTDTNPSYS
jgi:hypothetical protein